MNISRSDKLILVIAVILFATFLILGSFIVFEEGEHIDGTYADDLLDIARIIALDQEIGTRLDNKDRSLDTYVDRYYDVVNELSFVVIIDMDLIQYSHPVTSKVLNDYSGHDATEALAGREYTSVAQGPLGESLHAFVPVYKDNVQVGVVVVGLLTDDIIEAKTNLLFKIVLVFAVGLIISLFGLWLLRNRFKNDLFGFSPSEIALLYAENKSIIEQLEEAVISIDKKYRILTLNSVLKQRFDLSDDCIGKKVFDIFPHVDFEEIINNDSHIVNKYKKIDEQKLLMNAFPLYLESEIIGATAIFRSHLEVDTLLDQIEGYQQIAIALRSQKHEFQNKLHVVLGLIKMKDYLKAENYIMENVYTTNLASDYYSSRIKDDRILALFVGKEIQSKEYNAQLLLTSDTFLSKAHYPINSDDIVLVLGNLIDNSFEAYISKDMEDKRIVVDMFEDDDIVKITVVDQAGGISPKVINKMFERGVSSKKGPNRGTGLSLVSEIVSVYNGEKNVLSSKDETKIEIILEKVIR